MRFNHEWNGKTVGINKMCCTVLPEFKRLGVMSQNEITALTNYFYGDSNDTFGYLKSGLEKLNKVWTIVE